jgi:hypothetical protein
MNFEMTEPANNFDSAATRDNAPQPERAGETLLGSDDGKWIFESIFAALKNKTVAAAA